MKMVAMFQVYQALQQTKLKASKMRSQMKQKTLSSRTSIFKWLSTR